MTSPIIAILAGEELLASFFDERRRERLSRFSRWTLFPTLKAKIGEASRLAGADALITTWDSPYLSVEAMKQMPSVRIIAHCGGEVKKPVLVRPMRCHSEWLRAFASRKNSAVSWTMRGGFRNQGWAVDRRSS